MKPEAGGGSSSSSSSGRHMSKCVYARSTGTKLDDKAAAHSPNMQRVPRGVWWASQPDGWQLYFGKSIRLYVCGGSGRGRRGWGVGGVLSCRSSGLALFFSPHPPPRKKAFLKDNWRVCCRRRRVMEICLMRDCGAWRMREREDRERRESVRKRRTWFKDMNFLNKDRGKNNLILSCRSQYNIFCLCEIFKNVPSRILI